MYKKAWCAVCSRTWNADEPKPRSSEKVWNVRRNRIFLNACFLSCLLVYETSYNAAFVSSITSSCLVLLHCRLFSHFFSSSISSQLVNSSQVYRLFIPVRLPYIRRILSAYLSLSVTLPFYCIPSHLPLLSFPVLGLSFLSSPSV